MTFSCIICIFSNERIMSSTGVFIRFFLPGRHRAMCLRAPRCPWLLYKTYCVPRKLEWLLLGCSSKKKHLRANVSDRKSAYSVKHPAVLPPQNGFRGKFSGTRSHAHQLGQPSRSVSIVRSYSIQYFEIWHAKMTRSSWDQGRQIHGNSVTVWSEFKSP